MVVFHSSKLELLRCSFAMVTLVFEWEFKNIYQELQVPCVAGIDSAIKNGLHVEMMSEEHSEM